MNDFDTILGNTGTVSGDTDAPVIVSVQNDASRINWVNGLSDPGEMVRCGYLPSARRRQGESDVEYAGRIQGIIDALPANERALIMKAGRGAATKRAALDTSNGKVAVMVSGEAAWHKLGVNVKDAVTSGHAIGLAGLEWRVKKMPAYYDWQGERRESKDTFLLVRDDTGAQLGTVGSRYSSIQNADGFAYLDEVLAQVGAKYATAGAVYGGKKVWMQAELPAGFTLPGGDENMAYVMFTNAHDGTAAAQVIPTSFRAVCANTLRIAMNGAKGGLSIRHTGDIRGKIGDAKRLLGLAVEGFADFRRKAEVMAQTPLEVEPFTEEVFDIVLGVTAAKQEYEAKQADPLTLALALTSAEERWKRLEERQDALIVETLTAYESPTCAANRGTAWTCYNALSQVADHGSYAAPKRGTSEEKLSRRFESVLTGDSDTLKQTAFRMAQR